MTSREIIIDPKLWKVLIGVLLLCFSFLVYRRTYPPIRTARRILLGALRACVFVSLVLFLLDPALVETAVERIEPTIIALVDCSRSMSIEDCGGVSRIGCALEGVEELRRGLDERGGAELMVLPFAGAHDAGGRDGAFSADGEGTDIVGALSDAERGNRHRNLGGIVLFSDGRITRGMLAPDLAMPVPVYAVGVGDTVGPPDLSMDDVEFEAVAYTGSESRIEAVIGATGFGGSTVTVRLLDGDQELDRERMRIEGDRGKGAVELDFRPDRPGSKRLLVEVLPAPGEEWVGNNSEVIGIRVLKEKIHILFFDRFADWNATFLRDLVRRTERFDMTGVTWTEDRGYIELPGYRGLDLADGALVFDRYDLVVISDDGALLSDQAMARAAVRFVEGGGALLLIADEHSPLAVPGGLEALDGLLPVIQRGSARVETGEYGVSVSPDGAGHPLSAVLQQAGPPLSGRIAGIGLSSAATAPLVLTDGRGSYPFLALQRSGGGIAAALLGFPLWRWKLGADGSAYDAFFAALIQYLIEGERTPLIAIESARSAYRTGERIALHLVTRAGAGLDRVKGEIQAGERGGEIVATHLFELGTDGHARATIDPLPQGEYMAVVRATGADGTAHEASTGFTVLSVSTEFVEISRDMDLLRRLARVSGGRAVELDAMAELVESFELTAAGRERKQSIELRGSSLLLMATILLLTAEWALRKLWGLV